MRAVLTAIFIALFALAPPALALKGGRSMKDYEKVFGVDFARNTGFNAILTRTSVWGNLFYPDEQPKFRFQLQNKTGQPLKLTGKVDIIAYGTRGMPGKMWLPEVYKINDVGSIPIEIDMPGNGWQDFDIAPKTPLTKGGYALVVDLGKHGRQVLTTYTRVFKPIDKRYQYGHQALDLRAPEMLERLGVQAIRQNIPFVPQASNKSKAHLQKIDAFFKKCHKHKVTILVQIGASGEAMLHPIGRGRPHLDKDDMMKGGKQDLAWMPKFDPEVEEFVYHLAKTYGWPKGPVTAFNLWNEPWESSSISGWQADIPRYRAIYQRIAAGVLKAREQDDVDVLVGGCDSSTNAWDKLFCDDPDKFLPIFDFVSIHYQALRAPVLYKNWNNRKHHKGRVLIWDTESWVANTDDRVAGVLASYRAAGYDRVVAIGHYLAGGVDRWGNTRSVTIKTKAGPKSIPGLPQSYSLCAAVSTLQHFIGERQFDRILFQNGLPWIYIFKGLDGNVEDSTAVVLGDLSVTENDKPDGQLFRTVRSLHEARAKEELWQAYDALPADAVAKRKEVLAKLKEVLRFRHASLTIDNRNEQFNLHDFYGNPVAANGKSIQVPLDRRGFYLRGNGKPGSFAALVKALQTARIDGLQPIEIIARDMTADLDQQPVIQLQLTNVLNRPVTGTLRAAIPGFQLEHPPTVSFTAHETKTVPLKVLKAKRNPRNLYPLQVRIDAGKDGFALLREDMRVNLIRRQTVKIDGKLDDWKGALPQSIQTDEAASRSLEEAAWLPFESFDAGKAGGMATGYLAYDKDYFYFAAKVADTTQHPGTLRFAERDDDSFFYPEVSYEVDQRRTIVAKLVDVGGQKAWQSMARQLAYRFDLPKLTQVTFKVQSPAKLQFEVRDPATGKNIQRGKRVNGKGYVKYRLQGKVDVHITVRHRRRHAVVLGIFLDPPKPDKKGNTKPGFAGMDEKTNGKWQGTFGSLGNMLPGQKPKLPARTSIGVINEPVKKAYHWPKDVRRYSYRRRFISPDGSTGGFDNIQIAFNAVPDDEEDNWQTTLPGRPERFWSAYKDTDYEYALNTVSPKYGGGFEVWRLATPGMPHKHFFPRQPKHKLEGAVTKARLVTVHEGSTRITECAIPWSEIPHVRQCLDQGKPIKFSFRVNNEKRGPVMELAKNRSVSKANRMAFHVVWTVHWANEVEFAFEK